jgi:hypothetical protein
MSVCLIQVQVAHSAVIPRFYVHSCLVPVEACSGMIGPVLC